MSVTVRIWPVSDIWESSNVSLTGTRVRVEHCRSHYNAIKRHRNLGYLTPSQFRQQHQSKRAIPKE